MLKERMYPHMMVTDHTRIDSDTSLKNRVYTLIKNNIIFGRLQSGDQLNMLEISNRLNISSAPIREALNLLAKEGFVDLTPRKRATVSYIQESDVQIIVFLRQTLEPYAARLSVGKIPVERIQELRKMLLEVLESPFNAERYVASDIALHELLHQYAGSPLLSEIISNVKDRSLRLRYIAKSSAPSDSMGASDRREIYKISTEEHLGILSAFEADAPDLVYQRVSQHIANSSARLGDVLDSAQIKKD